MQLENIEDLYPLTPMQEGILFHTLLEPEAAHYFRQWSCVLRGRLDVMALEQAWQEIVDRHTILRTAFVWEEMEAPFQVVCRRVKIPFQRGDWRGLSPREQELRLELFREQDRRAGFDLTAAPLLRISVFELGDDLHRMVWSFHHLLLDGLSVALVMRRVIGCYQALCGRQPAPPQSSRPFRDYISWLKGCDLAGAETYWRGALRGFTTPTPLGIDRRGDAEAATSASQRDRSLAIPAATTEALRGLGRRHQVTLNTVVQGAWALLLGEMSGEADVVFGAAVSGRPADLPDAESMVGLFINTLPVRARLDPGRPWIEWLRALQIDQAEARHYDYSPLLRVQQWSEVPAGRALFQSIVVFENYRVEEAAPARSEELQVEGASFFDGTNYPLSLIVRPGPQLGLRLIYDPDRFDGTAIVRLLEHFRAALEDAVAHPRARLDELSPLTAAERHQLCREWNDVEEGPGEPAFIQDRFAARARLAPGSLAVVAAGEELTYAELDRRANRLAHHLQDLGVGPETLVGFAVERSADLVVGLLGVLKAGGAYVPLDPAYPQERLRYMMEHSGAPLLVTQERLLASLPETGMRVVALDRDREEIARRPAEPLRPIGTAPLHPESLAYVIYTSGSTGRPKGVQISHRALGNFLDSMARRPGLAAGDRLVAVTSLSFDIAGLEIFLPLLAGGTIDLVSREVAMDGVRLAEKLAGAAALQATPATWRLLLDAGWKGEAGLRALCGGEAVKPRLVADLAPCVGSLWNMYGPTETTIWSSVHPVAAGDFTDAGTVPIGRPIAATAIHVLDAALRPAPIGLPGDLYIGGAGLARGYLSGPDLTAQAFLPDPFGKTPGARIYRTGDVARFLPDGRLDCLGRKDHQVKVRGFRIELGEIETALTRHPAVHEAAAAVWGEGVGSWIAAYWVAADDAEAPAPSELAAHLRGLLPEYMLPAVFVRVEALPLTPNRKVDRKALPEPLALPAAGEPGAETARSPVEDLLAGVWTQVLKLDRVRPQDSFFALGGHSLLATQVVSRIDKVLGVRLSLRTLFERPTLAELARAVEEARGRQTHGSSAPPPLAPVARDRPLRLSFSQQRLWFLDQLEPGSSAYNVPRSFRLSGELDVTAFRSALGALIRRHEVLRTTFPAAGGVPLQVVHPAAPPALSVIDLTALDPAGREVEARRLADLEARQPFDLAAGPLLRPRLLRLTAADHVALLTLHHIVSDGWSSGVLIGDLARLYRSFAEGVPAELPDLPVQYVDYAEWQRGWLNGGILEAELAFWRERLAGVPRLLELPTDRPRPMILGDAGGGKLFRLPPELTRSLRDLARREGSTLFMSLAAGFSSLLSRYSGQERFALGTPVAGRTRIELEELIGFFVNTLVLPLDLSGGPSFLDLLERVRAGVLDAHAHQDLPFERIVEELQPERSLSHSPLFQVVLVLQNAPRETLDLPGLSLRQFGSDRRTSKFDLTLILSEQAEGLAGLLEYNAALFDPATVARLAGHFQSALEAAVAAPERAVSSLPLLGAGERHQVQVEWNDRRSDIPGERCVHELFEREAERRADRVAVTSGDVALSYGELNAMANRLAHRLRRLGVGPEVPVALCAERSAELIIGLLAVLKAGGYFVPLDPRAPAERLALLLEDIGAPVVLTQGSLAGSLPQVAASVFLDKPGDWGEESTDNPVSGAVSRNLAYVMYTSGSTGRPKGVAVEHRSVVRLVRGNDFAVFGEEEVFLQLAPLAFDASTLEVWGPLLNGGRLVVMAAGVAGLDELGEVLRREGVSTLWLTAGLFHQMVEHNLENLAGVRQLLAGGDVLSPSHVRRLRRELPGLRLINGYGPTEGTTFTCCYPVDDAEALETSVPIGRPIRNTTVHVLSRELLAQPVGVPGELYTGGWGLARGYLGRPELTAERFVPNPSGPPGDRLYRTGDQARALRDGTIEFLGRLDQQVKIRGFRVELGEIEAVLLAHPAVLAAAATVRQDARGDKTLVGYVVPREPSGFALAEVQGDLRDRLPEYMVPSSWVLLDTLPLNPNGKVDRRALPAPAAAEAVRGAEAAAFRTLTEELLAAVWCEVLGRERVDPEDDFFSLGGHSLLATQLVSRIRSLFAVELPLRAVFEAPVLSELAGAVERERGAGSTARSEPLLPVPRSVGLPLSFAQQRLWFIEQLEPSGAAYNVPVILRVAGLLDTAVLRGTLTEVVRRHEVLRTTFPAPHGDPEQRIHPPTELPLPVVDLSALPESVRWREAELQAHQAARRLFDLEQGPVLRAQLLRLGAEDHVVSVTMHHIVSDGWSLGVLTREVTALYPALAEGRCSPLPELPVQYADFAVWQRSWLSGETLRAETSYWRERLAGIPPLLNLPLDRPRPPLQTFRGRSLPLALPEGAGGAVAAFGRRFGATPFMVLLAAFQAQLGRLAAEERVAVGSPIAGRTRAETEGLIGVFVNTLVLRGDLSGDPEFGELLERVREVTLGAYEHQELPFERLVEELAPDRSLAHPPLFQVMFSLQNAPAGELELPGLSLTPLPTRVETAKFDLSLGFRGGAENLLGSLEYNLDLFDAATARRLVMQLAGLLEAALARPDLRLSELPLLSAAERHALTWEWRGGPGAMPRACLHQLVEEQTTLRPQAPALVASSLEAVSYGELERRSSALALELRRQGVGPEVVVGVLAERDPSLGIGMLAIWKAGGAYLPLDPAYPRERLAFMLEDSGAPVVLAMERSGELAAALTGDRRRVIFLDSPAAPAVAPVKAALPGAGPGNLAYVIYTSGSTGRPKGVGVEHGAACEHFLAVAQLWGLGEGDRVHLFSSPSFDASLDEVVPALLSGAAVTFDPELWEPSQILQRSADFGLTVFDLPTAYWNRWVAAVTPGELPPAGLKLRHVVTAGEAMTVETARAWRRTPMAGIRLWNAYGPTEGVVTATWHTVGEERTVSGTVPIGGPGRERSAHVVERAGRLAPLGAPGELLLGGPLLARGYLGRPDLTAERFIPDLFGGQPGGRLYRTGDLARRLPDGNIEFLGRIDQQVKIRGFRIELGEIESILLRHPGVREAIVLAREDEPGHKLLAAYVVPRQQALPVAALRSYLEERLPEYMLPAAWTVLEALPLSPNGKVDRRALPVPARPGAASGTEPVIFRTITEELLAGIWCEVLRVEQVAAEDDFFALGGHSLLATQLVSRVRQAFGVEMAVRVVFEAPTVSGLAAAVDRLRLEPGGAPALPLLPVPRTGRLPLSFAQQRLWFLDQ
ncbi:MAG TPA: amino acid adenylation domain-containing protein, partial [Thermoanaerobaculia bacterium]|nr:amino acid adenylation domain-containing protein [Thermoanaerobaculia bacterium]